MAQAVPPGGIYHIDIYQLQNAKTHPYFVDVRTKRTYFRGRQLLEDNSLAFDLIVGPSGPPVGTLGWLMTEEQWRQFDQGQEMQGEPCVIDPPPHAPQVVGPFPRQEPATVPLPDDFRATVANLRTIRSHPYFVDAAVERIYYLGQEIIRGRSRDVPVTRSFSPPVRTLGWLMTREQWLESLKDQQLRGNPCIIEAPPQVPPSPAAGPVPRFSPALDILHATVTSLRDCASPPYFVVNSHTAYYRGSQIKGDLRDLTPSVYGVTPPVGTRGCLMSRKEWLQFVEDRKMRGKPCIIEAPKAAPPPAAGLVPQFSPAVGLFSFHATVADLRSMHSYPIFVDSVTQIAYYLGEEIVGEGDPPSTRPFSPSVGTKGYLMTKEQWSHFRRDRQLRGDPCIINAPKAAPPPAAGPAPQFSPTPSIFYATVTSLQNARSRQYLVDPRKREAYYLGKKISGGHLNPVPITDPTSTPPVGMRGLLMTKEQWVDYCAGRGFSGDVCVIVPE